ncbi:MAG: hypothetical protein ACI9MR_005226 [Myxococcota bacterium]|jgi:hypothetical protein
MHLDALGLRAHIRLGIPCSVALGPVRLGPTRILDDDLVAGLLTRTLQQELTLGLVRRVAIGRGGGSAFQQPLHPLRLTPDALSLALCAGPSQQIIALNAARIGAAHKKDRSVTSFIIKPLLKRFGQLGQGSG